uniref:Toll-like receptor 2 n=1 Tax=Sphenodon punctatus TaxID=8508 RepID=A0A8D0H6E3_SPHPU
MSHIWRVWFIYANIDVNLSEQTMDQICSSCNATHFCDCSSMYLHTIPSGLTNDITGLNLAYNRIQHVRNTDLKHGVNLRTLLLQSSQIEIIDEDSFHFLGKLEHLDLSNNSLTHLSSAWFRNLLSLQHLNIKGNNYSALGENPLFSNLKNLRCLFLGNDYFFGIWKQDFKGISVLEELHIGGQIFMQYEQGSLKAIESISHITINVKHTDTLPLIIKDIVNSTVCLELRNTDLSNVMEISALNLMVQSVVKKVVFNSVSFTDASVAGMGIILGSIKQLQEVEMEDFVLHGTGQWEKHSELKYSNSIKVVTIKNLTIEKFYLFSDLAGVVYMIHKLTKVTVTNTNVFLVPCIVSKFLSSMEYLDLSENLLLDHTLEHSACPGAWPLLQTLNLSQNSLNSLEKTGRTLAHLKHLIHLDVSQNNFGQMPASCKWPENLKYLNLSGSQIPKLTSCLPQTLEILDVSGNNLEDFGLKLPLLKELYIGSNKLKTLPDAGLIPAIRVLSISRNKLNSFSEGQEKQVGAARLSLTECHRTLVVCLSCILTFLVILVTVILCYKLHVIWYMKMTWAWLQAKRKPPKAHNKDICYDAFVSYSERDSEWVENLLVQELEQAIPPFKLCLHKRDFVPGKWIVDNIIDSIEKSHKTLFVLSDHFVQSEWCKYELDFSHFRLFDENSDTAILILLEPIQEKTIPKRFCKLRKIMNTRTYLEWPPDEEQQQLFWFNLKVALKSKEELF